MVDTHCHLDFSFFDGVLQNTLAAAKQAGVDKFILPAVNVCNWQKISDITADFLNVYPAYGIHPWLQSYTAGDLDKLSNWLENNYVIAIGECGLDFYRTKSNIELQTEVFLTQINLAKEYNLPLIIHSTKAVDEVLKILKNYGITKGVFHGFSGSMQQADRVIAAGFYIGIGGLICNKMTKVRKLVKDLPLDRILLETDSPDQGVYGVDKNTPANIMYIAQELALIKNIELETVKTQCDLNAKTCFYKLNEDRSG